MFLDKKLEQIYKEQGLTPSCSKALFDACIDRMPNPDTCSTKDWLNTLKQVEASWKLFAKRHKEFKLDGFQRIMCDIIKVPESIKKYMHWT